MHEAREPHESRDSTDERPRLKPPAAEFNADEIALVRPYFTAHETEAEAARLQDRAAARLRAWGADLEYGPDSTFSLDPAPEGTRAYTLDEYPAPNSAPGPDPASAPGSEPSAGTHGHADRSADPTDTFHIPAPRIPSPRIPARMDGLPHLSRIRARQQQRRGQDRVLEGAVG